MVTPAPGSASGAPAARVAPQVAAAPSSASASVPATGLFIGLMSGTSLDGVDGVLADFSAQPPRILAHASAPFPDALRQALLALNTPGENELHRAALAGNGLARVYAEVVQALLAKAGVPAKSVLAIGAHGQTVRHRPGEFDGTGYTLQLNQPALLAELTGIAVAADFRSRDVAAGGQGAPLAPLFHRAWFGEGVPQGQGLALLNLGGIANLTLLRADGGCTGFDCGPANVLMDGWIARHRGQAYDAGGAWAASGRVLPDLLARLRAEPFFERQPPKSTGRDLFHLDWLDAHFSSHLSADRAATGPAAVDAALAADVQATLAELTAVTCAEDLQRHGGGAIGRLVVCGGGALNTHLMARLAALLPGVQVLPSGDLGLPPLQVEAAAFAWLAWQTVQGQAQPLQSITGAKGARVLGCIYPA